MDISHSLSASRNRHILLVDDMPSIHADFRKILAPPPAAEKLRQMEGAVFGTPQTPARTGFELDSAYQAHSTSGSGWWDPPESPSGEGQARAGP